jgi:hypothetical protein
VLLVLVLVLLLLLLSLQHFQGASAVIQSGHAMGSSTLYDQKAV